MEFQLCLQLGDPSLLPPGPHKREKLEDASPNIVVPWGPHSRDGSVDCCCRNLVGEGLTEGHKDIPPPTPVGNQGSLAGLSSVDPEEGNFFAMALPGINGHEL